MVDVHDKITNDLEDACERLGWNSLYVEEYVAAAAVKASVLFQALGYDYGDRIPGVYKLQDTITECLNQVAKSIIINTPKGNYNDLSCSTGMFTVRGYFEEWDDSNERGQWQFSVSFDLLDFAEHRVKDEE